MRPRSKDPIQSWLVLSGILIVFVGATVHASEHKISQKNKVFSTGEITIKKGDLVTFSNDEKDITHNVYSLGPKNPFELKTQAPGQTSSVSFADSGEAMVECAIHPTMRLKIKVE